MRFCSGKIWCYSLLKLPILEVLDRLKILLPIERRGITATHVLVAEVVDGHHSRVLRGFDDG